MSKRSDSDVSGPSSHETIPPVPSIPVLALPSHKGPRPSSSSSAQSPRAKPHPSLAPNGYTHVRRPSTAPNPATTTVRRSAVNGPPSVSRVPELNWLSQAAPPKFSRNSIKLDGVVMPVSAKDAKRAKRHSTVSTISPLPPSHGSRNGKETLREGTPIPLSLAGPPRSPSESSLVSLEAYAPPSPPFRASSRTGSSSSVDSTLSITPPSTPGLSVSRSPSVTSVDDVDELGAKRDSIYVEHRTRDKDEPHVVEVQETVSMGSPRALTKEVAEAAVRENHSHSDTAASPVDSAAKAAAPAASKGGEASKLQRGKGTLKRAFRRMFGSVKT